MGRLECIWIKRAHRGPMDPVSRGVLEERCGLLGNTGRSRRRQVTILSADRWAELTAELGAHLDPSVRRANLLVSGLELQHSRGRRLLVGACVLRIGGETRPCERMDEVWRGLQAIMCARWGGGAFAEVIRGGEIGVGDSAEWDGSLG
jgi:MOSC domain-containing protein YiiM